MSCIVSRAFTLFADARDTCKRFTRVFCNTVVNSPQRKKKNYTFFELKWLIYMYRYVEKSSLFSLFALYASDNLVHILVELGTFHAHYTNHKN